MSQDKQVRVIEVVPHNLHWQEEFIKAADELRKIFGAEVVEIHHIGSTAIPGIYAKPVIDILIVVRDISVIDSYNDRMSEAGYIARGENGIAGRRYFLKGLYNRTHHVHIFQAENPEIDKHLNFRDYLIHHPEEGKRYGALKKELAEKFRFDSLSYVDGKDAYIKEVDKKAQEWKKRIC